MIVTAVERRHGRHKRVVVHVDGQIAFEIARDAAREQDLRPGRTIAQTQIDALVAADAKRRAFDVAGAMLARRPRSEREIRLRLRRSRFEPSLVDATVERLRAARLIDDAEFARAFTESRDRSSPRGRRLLAQELRTFGVDAPIARSVVEQVSEPDAAYRLASRRVRSLASLDYRAFRTRLAGHLQRRGFGWDVVRTTIDRCWRELGHGAPDDVEESIE
jgi:regulatory protein